MNKKSDKDLGMRQSISRRDFIHDAGLAALGMGLMPLSVGNAAAATEAKSTSGSATADYPPVRTGLRGSHPGSFEVGHALAREGKAFSEPRDVGEVYDLVIVGAGISGLATAHYYRQRFGADSRILLLENHDDFGGHAKRNEFHQGGRMVLSMGGVHNLEYWKFSDTVNAFLKEHGVDIEDMLGRKEFDYGRTAPNSPAMWFDKETYGVDRLLTRFDLSSPLTSQQIDEIPISDAGRDSLKAFFAAKEHRLADYDAEALEAYLGSISYPEFLQRHGGLTADATQLWDKQLHGGYGTEMRALSAREALGYGYAGAHILGGDWSDGGWNYNPAMWPDGNASLARLQVARLVPDTAPGVNSGNVAVSRFDYGQLDQPGGSVRLRLSSTVVNVDDSGDDVAVTYVRDGEVLRVRSRHAVMACYHVIMPHLCPALPEPQKEAMKYQVKIPLVLINVLIRNTDALDRLGVDGVSCPGRMLESVFTFRGINTGGFEHGIDDEGPVSLILWGSLSPPQEAIDVHAQLRASRTQMLALSFEDYEREVRTVLDGLLGPAGFDVATDVLAITVNRWPHGYAYEYMDLWDDDFAPGEAPHEIARQPFGRIAIANADAGASAYTHVAIDEAYRAVQDLPDG